MLGQKNKQTTTSLEQSWAHIQAIMSTFFLSYAGTFHAIATQIAQGLQGAKVAAGWDQGGLGWGNNWIQTFRDKLSQSTEFMILISSTGVRKMNC